jgi:hypothetical protein
MLKLMAVARTLFLVFIVAFTGRVVFVSDFMAQTPEEYARCTSAAYGLRWAAVYLLAWLALETIVGWWLATRRPRAAAPPAAGEPPAPKLP